MNSLLVSVQFNILNHQVLNLAGIEAVVLVGGMDVLQGEVAEDEVFFHINLEEVGCLDIDIAYSDVADGGHGHVGTFLLVVELCPGRGLDS